MTMPCLLLTFVLGKLIGSCEFGRMFSHHPSTGTARYLLLHLRHAQIIFTLIISVLPGLVFYEDRAV
jgi:hypothetical protein